MPMNDVSRLNEEALRTIIEGWAREIDIPAQDARLHFNPATGQVEVLQPSIVGRQLNVETTVEAVRQALAGNSAQVRLPVEAIAPQVDASKIGEMGIKELVAAGTTYFRGSSVARIHNIEVATEKFVGIVIPPGEIFSFNKTVADVSAANGFEDSAIIWGDQTMVGVGGGVCQVSTTVFRAALNAGLPIVERYNHGYVVSWYGDPGMDATIYTPSVDLKFRNDTGAYLLVQPAVDSSNGVLTFNFYGTKPNRQVTIGEPVISDVKEPGEPVYRVDESLAPGERRQVEYAQRGMTVTVERTVTENGQTRVDKIVSNYQPWNAVYLVAPGTEIPATPTPQATAEITATTTP
jgi:vancomycin resistance protein YoaR